MPFRRPCRPYLLAVVAVLGAGVVAVPAPGRADAPPSVGTAKPADPASDRAVAAALVRQAEKLVRVEDYSKAVALLTRALEIDPKAAEALRLRGTTYLRLATADGDLRRLERRYGVNRADAAAGASLVVLPPDALRARGRELYRLGRYPEALADLTRAIAADEDDPESYYFRGLVYAAQNDGPRALADYRAYRERRGPVPPARPSSDRARDPRML